MYKNSYYINSYTYVVIPVASSQIDNSQNITKEMIQRHFA